MTVVSNDDRERARFHVYLAASQEASCALYKPASDELLAEIRRSFIARLKKFQNDHTIPGPDWFDVTYTRVFRDPHDRCKATLRAPAMLRAWLYYADHVSSLPAHPHDCNGCVYLGCIPADTSEPGSTQQDLYFCEQNGGVPTLIARFGPGPDYMSGLDVAIAYEKVGREDPLTVALELATERGFVRQRRGSASSFVATAS